MTAVDIKHKRHVADVVNGRAPVSKCRIASLPNVSKIPPYNYYWYLIMTQVYMFNVAFLIVTFI